MHCIHWTLETLNTKLTDRKLCTFLRFFVPAFVVEISQLNSARQFIENNWSDDINSSSPDRSELSDRKTPLCLLIGSTYVVMLCRYSVMYFIYLLAVLPDADS